MADEKDINVEHEELHEDEIETPMERFFFHQRRALEETGKALEALLPPNFRDHAGEASKEFAKGFRVLVDAAIDELKAVSEREETKATEKDKSADGEDDSTDDDDPPTTTGKTKVRVKLD
ncbi:MAG: hypothetical protein ACFE0Q_15860 [Anaerolineae bacterium]